MKFKTNKNQKEVLMTLGYDILQEVALTLDENDSSAPLVSFHQKTGSKFEIGERVPIKPWD